MLLSSEGSRFALEAGWHVAGLHTSSSAAAVSAFQAGHHTGKGNTLASTAPSDSIAEAALSLEGMALTIALTSTQ